ncbi:reverse transcriptase [Gossypium australe]|uniref:Reverse transcriptase n=1 Tax=Gossypium australe TaxID=47621 RepID=A0A5B6UMR1_9ROSI|nr:reverse transcriptase [Gossypium australe]
MGNMGFDMRWIDLIMKCITTVSYAVIINENRGRPFQPTMGLRQGDPPSPFLFLICSKGLSALMRLAKTKGLVKGAKASRKGPEISHLLFVDDCILFGEATEKGARALKEILKEYEVSSGQCVNFNKSTIFYSTNTNEESKAVVSTMLGVRSSSSPEKYLGLPNIVGRRKKEAFLNWIDRIAVRIEAWSSRFLSQGGKEIFIKLILQAIPTYAMSCFLFPKSLCEKIENKIANFLWQKGAGKRGIHWCQWKFLCRPKEEGGLGFKSMAQFNISLLAKQESLVAQVFKAKYFPESNFLNSRLGNSCSYVWRNIWAAKDTLKKGLTWRVGTGQNISISDDAWIPNYANIRLLSRFDNLQCDKVAELIDSNSREWNRELVVDTFPKEVADLILWISLAVAPHEDFLVWNGEPSGEFSVRSSYKLLQSLDPTAYALQTIYRDSYKKLWRTDIPTKIKVFIWKTTWNYLATKVSMHARRLAANSSCPRCSGGEETLNHLFRVCPVSMAVWRVLSDINLAVYTQVEFVDWLTMLLISILLTKCRTFCVALWAIWGERNYCIHDRTSRSGQEIVSFILSYVKELDSIKKTSHNTFPVDIKWRHPSGQEVKVNFDGAFDGRNKCSASGVVARDSSGQVLVSSTKIHRGVDSAFAAEALACRRATQIALEMESTNMIIEGDSLSTIKKCMKNSLDKSQIGPLIHDVHQMKSRRNNLKFKFIPRSANKLAHLLATETLKRKEEMYLLNRAPWYAESQARDECIREPD